MREKIESLLNGNNPFTGQPFSNDSVWKHPEILRLLEKILGAEIDQPENTLITEIQNQETEESDYFKLEDITGFEETGLSREEMIQRRQDNSQNGFLLNRGCPITDLEKDELIIKYRTVPNLERLEIFFQRSRKSLNIMLNSRGIIYFSERTCTTCGEHIPVPRLNVLPETNLCFNCANNEP